MNQPHAITVEEVARTLGTDLRHGLSAAVAAERLSADGPNSLPEEEKSSAILKFLRQFHSGLTYILLAVAAISLATDHANDAYAVLFSVLIKVVVGFIQERRAEEAVAKLKAMITLETRVLRDGHEQNMRVEQLVAGDIILLKEGDRVPADARVATSRDLTTDESPLTGESMSVAKQAAPVSAVASVGDRTDMVWMGTAVVAGEGVAVVIGTGARTEFGRIASSLTAIKRKKTPFELRVDSLGRRIGLGSLVLAAIVFGLSLARGNNLFDTFFFAVALVVSVIPEGLPAILAVALAIGVIRMSRRNAIVRHLPSVETLGNADVICTDKTGTLTENKMTVKQISLLRREVAVTGDGWLPEGEFLSGDHRLLPADIPELDRLLVAAALTSTASLQWVNGQPGISGDPTEGALTVLAAKGGREQRELSESYRLIDEIPFSSTRKFRARLFEFTDVDGQVTRKIFVVGANEVIWSKAQTVLAFGKKIPFDTAALTDMTQANEAMAYRAMRVLSLGYRTVTTVHDSIHENDLHDLTLLGLVGMTDPPRHGVRAAIEQCRSAGIRVIMLTGDQKTTALAVAREVGLRQDSSKNGVYTDADVASMDEAAFSRAMDDATIFARVSPETKLRIVRHLSARDLTVAMTGDGVNDAPALKQAAVGIAMGRTGTDVSREVSDIVLTDDNFVSIVGAIEEGRIVFRNVRQTTTYLFMTNMGEALTIVVGLAIGLPLPLLPVQILWMNLVTDGVNDVALATEREDGDVLRQKPHGKRSPIITKSAVLLTALTAAIMCAGTLLLFVRANRTGDIDYARTIAFTAMALFQLWNVMSMRSAYKSVFSLGFLSNRYVVYALVASFCLQLAALYLPFLSELLHVQPLGLGDWAILIVATAPIFLAVESYKVACRKGWIPERWT